MNLPSPMPSVTICCPSYMGASRAKLCLWAIRRITDYDGKWDLVLVDDGSPSSEMRRELAGVAASYEASFVQHPANLGTAVAANTGIRESDSDYVVVISDDVEVTDHDWLTALVGFLDLNNERGINVGPVGMADHGMAKPDLRHTPAPYCLAFSRDLFERIGGFSQEFAYYYADTAFCLEARKREFMPAQLGWPTVMHGVSQTLNQYAELRDIEIPEVMVRDLRRSFQTKRRYGAYREVAGLTALPYEKWIDTIVSINPRSSVARYLFCLEYDLGDMLEHYHDEMYAKYILPLEKRWHESPIAWVERHDGQLTIAGGKE